MSSTMIKEKAVLDIEPIVNVGIRTAVLVLLCCQNAGHALLTRYSQGVLKESYSSTEVVLVGEVIKILFSGYLAVVDRSETDASGTGFSKLVWLLMHSRKIVILVILYSFANIMSYYALARVDASVYTVLLQLKIFSTAAFAVLLLGRSISAPKWRALLLLVLGCILVASPTFNRPIECTLELINARKGVKTVLPAARTTDDDALSPIEALLGISSVLAMVAISGYSAIYFEAMLKQKGEKITIWERNFQLAFYSIVLLCIILLYEVMSNTAELGSLPPRIFFRGWTINTIFISLIQAGGGLLVAATLKYADAVLKTLATSGSIVLSSVLGWLLLGGQLDIFVSIGAVATILAIFNYTLDS